MMKQPQAPSYPLEPDAAAMRALIDEVSRRVIEHIEGLPSQPAANAAGARQEARRLREPLPGRATPLTELLDLLFDRAVPRSFNTAGPGYLAYIPGGGLYESAVASFLADGVNRYVGVFAAAPLLAQLEANVVRWFAEIVGYPESARGFLTSGGSLANFSGVVTARREMLGDDFQRGLIYTSDQAHHSVIKAAILAGFPARNVRALGTDAAWRLDVAELERAIAADRDAGARPFLVVASAGTTNTGAVDPLEAIADVCDREDLWLHVDASYGGFFNLAPRGREVLAGLERAHTLVLDPHKTLFLPYGSGCLLARDGEALRRAHSVRADYMPPMQEEPDLVDFCEISPELSRGFRGLRVWLPLKLHGIEPFREALQEKLELTAWITQRLRQVDGVEIVAEPQLSVVAWRLRPPGLDGEALNDLNREVLDAINARGHVYLTPTRLHGDFVIRICVVSFRTHADRLEVAFEDILEALAEVLPRHLVAGAAPERRGVAGASEALTPGKG